MIVVDANVIVALVREGSLTPVARAIYAVDADWIVPPLWQPEVLNALLNEVKAGNVALDGAQEAADMAATLLRDRVRDCRPSAILTTAHTSRLTAYDATYVVLARSLGLLLVTEDKQILRACPDVARSMRRFLTPPEEKPAAVRYRSGCGYGLAKDQGDQAPMNKPVRPESPFLRRNLPAAQQSVQVLADQFNADERLWESLEPLRALRRKLHPRMSARKRKALDLRDFANAQAPKDCIGHRRIS